MPPPDTRSSFRVTWFHCSTFLLLMMPVAAPLLAQQVADTLFRPAIEKPAYAMRKGPVVLIDEAHFNFHTARGRYLPFGELLRRDGYVVKASAEKFAAEALKGAGTLVISNALNEMNSGDWEGPTLPAFTPEEVETVRDWVRGGGSLLLIIDHVPFPAAADELAKAFGARFLNGVAYKDSTGRLVFRRSDGTLIDHPVTQAIDSVATFTGSPFTLDAPGRPLLVFGPEVRAWQPSDSSEVSVAGQLQGAVIRFGKGRVALFGEAAMFTAQLAGLDQHPMGMNASIARQNPQFLLNVMHWLTGRNE